MNFLRIKLSVYVPVVAYRVATGVDPDYAALQCHSVSE